MTTDPFKVFKYGHPLPISDLALAAAQDHTDAMTNWLNASPEERAEWAREDREARERQRRETAPVPLTVDALLTKMDDWGWSRTYVEHLVQPYCGCGDSHDGWECCQHARDLGLAP